MSLVNPGVLAADVVARFGAETTVTEIEHSGHWPHLERAALVAAAIDRFLAFAAETRSVSASASM
jgi:pimeloyl-ACP methyl ester carboxylesterase